MTRIEREKRTLARMVALYCRHKEGNSSPCPDCEELLCYAHRRLDGCRFAQDKPTCNSCPVHCYSTHYRERIKTVMRYSGPRMIWYHPVDALRHALRGLIR